MASKHEDIADALIEDVLSARYRPGDRLPSERDLASRFDANRGAVREAMKKLEQIGLADIGPGGARACELSGASLDIIGPLLSRGAAPDYGLVDQILQVISTLVTLTAENVVVEASDVEIGRIRAKVAPLMGTELSAAEHELARIELMRTIMQTSGNLVCQLIARALLTQFSPSMEPLRGLVDPDSEAYTTHAIRLDRALSERNLDAVRAAFKAFNQLNRDTIMRAFSEAERLRSVTVSLPQVNHVDDQATTPNTSEVFAS